MTFVEFYGKSFGLTGRQSVEPLRASETDALGQEHQRLRQMHLGVPVTAGEIVVHLRGDRVLAANGHTLADLPATVTPTLAAGTAREEAEALVRKTAPELADGVRYSTPQLQVFNLGLLEEGNTYPTRLAWFVEARAEALREFIWIDAESGAVLKNFSQLTDVKNRSVHNLNHGTTLPGPVARTEGQAANADAEVNTAYDLSGITYDYYVGNHGRDSYDGAGALLRSSVHYSTNYANAFWNGTQMVYGDGYSTADDVVAHELTHAVTEFSANLLYNSQSGALNESYSDIFGEAVDQLFAVGNDAPAARWKLGEDLPIGAIRDMMTPTLFGDPGKMSDSGQFVCTAVDQQGVHSNSGVPNHAFALMVDGGTYNGRTVAAIGVIKATKIEYRALTTYLTSGSRFADNAAALNQACTDLVGQFGITGADCQQVATAVLAVEMANPWPCAAATPPPASFCPAGGTPQALFSDNFEGSLATRWTTNSAGGSQWSTSLEYARTGRTAYGPNLAVTSDLSMTMTNAVAIPAGGRMWFDHGFAFETSTNGATAFDGGVIEYTTNGTTWTDAASLIDGGLAYGGAVTSGFGNPLAGRQAFVKSSFGHTATRLNLASLAGQSVRFRFRVGNDSSVGSFGWFVDNAQIYSCGGAPAGPVAPSNFRVAAMSGATVTLAWDAPASGPTPQGYQLEGGVTPGSVMGAIPLGPTRSVTLALPSAPLYLRLRTIAGGTTSTPSNEILAYVNVPAPPSAPANLLGTAAGSSVFLAWTPTFGGGAPTSSVLEVSGALNAALPLGPTSTFAFAGVPNGTFTFRVRQTNAAGVSAQSNAVTLTFPSGCTGAPAVPRNFVASKVGTTLTLFWDPPASGGAPTSYVLSVSGAVNAVLPFAARTLTVPVPAGTYNFTVAGNNPCGTGPATALQSITLP